MPAQAPPNAPAQVTAAGDSVTVRYDGRVLLRATLAGAHGTARFESLVDSSSGRVTQLLKWTRLDEAPMTLTGTVTGSDEAFSAEVDPAPRSLRMVRHTVGLSASRLNRAVYDRARDWVLSVDVPARVVIDPDSRRDGQQRFRIAIRGPEITLRFRPRFYQRHRGLAYFEPWTYRVPRDVPTGWTSWYAYRDRITEGDVHRVADVMAERLAPYGYRYLQIDDGYQQNPIGVVDHWLTANANFPSGMGALARYINARGLTPAIWTNVSFADSAWAVAHRQYFVRDATGAAARGNWVGYVMHAADSATFAELLRPVYAGFARLGYRYFKVDALRHLRYEGYNSNSAYFEARHLDRAADFRAFMGRLRATLGPEAFILACWGIRPELVGLVDAVRIGDDGFGYGGLAQYNSFNNVVWRNDPDHIEVGQGDAYAAALATTLTGSHLMLTDRAEVYRTARVEVARRASPVPFTVPGQLYDVDPSRSSQLARADLEVSGSGPRPLDADQLSVTHLYLLELAMPFERWHVLGRTGGDAERLRFTELGLRDSTDYVVFDYWARRLVPTDGRTLALGPLDAVRRAQALCIREVQAHPQVVATDRHVTCGGPDLKAVTWTGTALEGTSTLVGGETYTLYLREPAGYRAGAVTAEGAQVVSSAREGGLRLVRLRSAAGRDVRWRAAYTP